jgi:pimeloyl-ACP methyl ester carboxylesterase
MGLSSREAAEVARADESGRQPVVLVHGLWLLPSSWAPWQELLEEEGYAAVAADWPDDPETVEEARAAPERFAGKSVGMVRDHVREVVQALTRPPVLVGHSFGGLIVQQLAGEGLARATVAIDPAPFKGVLPLPLSALRASSPVLLNPLHYRSQVMLTEAQFRYAFTNAVDESEAHRLYEEYAVPCSGIPLFQAATANLNPRAATRVDVKRRGRGPLLVISGEKDHTVPWALAHAAYKKQRANADVTEIVEIEGRGHSLVIDAGWTGVADAALDFLGRHDAD